VNIRPWAVEVEFPPQNFVETNKGWEQLPNSRVLKRFWKKESAEHYRELMIDLQSTDPREAYRRQVQFYAYHVVRTR